MSRVFSGEASQANRLGLQEDQPAIFSQFLMIKIETAHKNSHN